MIYRAADGKREGRKEEAAGHWLFLNPSYQSFGTLMSHIFRGEETPGLASGLFPTSFLFSTKNSS